MAVYLFLLFRLGVQVFFLYYFSDFVGWIERWFCCCIFFFSFLRSGWMDWEVVRGGWMLRRCWPHHAPQLRQAVARKNSPAENVELFTLVFDCKIKKMDRQHGKADKFHLEND